MRYLFVMLCVVLLCASVGNAALIYEFIDLLSASLAEIEFSALPADFNNNPGSIIGFHFTEAGNDIFGFGTAELLVSERLGKFSVATGVFIFADGAGGLKGDSGVNDETSLINNDLGLVFTFQAPDDYDLFMQLPGFGPPQQFIQGNWQVTPEPSTPEPSTLVLLALGFCVILGLGYRQRKKVA